jgi:cytochrome c-type biogenesis protein CcmH/NrfG
VRIDPNERGNWFVLEHHLLEIGDHRRAESILKRAVRLRPESVTCRFYLGTPLSRNGKYAETAAAFHNLYKSIECGFEDVDYLLRDSDFENIHEDPRWRVVVQSISGRNGS